MDFKRALPHPGLLSIVRSFSEVRIDLGSSVLRWPVPARPHQILDIHLADPYGFRLDGGPLHAGPEAFVAGPATYRRTHIHLTGQIHVFNILFQPAGLNRVAGLDMRLLTNQALPASDILGKSAAKLADAVRRGRDFTSRIEAAERCIAAMSELCGAEDVVGYMSRALAASRGLTRIDLLAERSGLSARQFQRRFSTQVGMTPKLFARTVRFDGVLLARRRAPDRSWTDIVHEFGYFDQAHFIRDCHALAGAPPSDFVGDWDNIIFPNG